MKKIYIIPLLLLAVSQLKAQQQALFKPAYAAKTTYTIAKDMKMSMDMDGSAAGGQSMVMLMSMSATALIATGAADQSHMLPIKITQKTDVVKMTMNGQEIPAASIPTPNIIMYGKYQIGGKLSLDSVSGSKMTDSVKAAMLKMVDNIQNNIKFPDHPLKIGESFTQDAPFAMPGLIGGGGNSMTVKMTYKLASITNNLAVFDFTENIDMNMRQNIQGQDLKMIMTGIGSGKLGYDVGTQFFTTLNNSLSMDFDINTNGAAMKGKATITSTDKTSIAAN